jgi:hypothetical protein
MVRLSSDILDVLASGLGIRLTAALLLRRFLDLVMALNRAGYAEEVVQLVDSKKFALNSAAAAEYLRALVETKRLSRLTDGGEPE